MSQVASETMADGGNTALKLHFDKSNGNRAKHRTRIGSTTSAASTHEVVEDDAFLALQQQQQQQQQQNQQEGQQEGQQQLDQVDIETPPSADTADGACPEHAEDFLELTKTTSDAICPICLCA